MPSETAAFAAVLGGGVLLYASFNHKRVIDVLLNRPSTLPSSSGPVTPGTESDSTLGFNVQSAGTVFAGIGKLPKRARLVSIAKKSTALEWSYAEVRPIPSSFNVPQPIVTDCSGFVTMCYKAAGAPDPNGLRYDGQGYTGTLEEHGTVTTNPQPGDLAFWSSPDHVAMYVGSGQVIGFGSGTQPLLDTVAQESQYHLSFIGYRTYPL